MSSRGFGLGGGGSGAWVGGFAWSDTAANGLRDLSEAVVSGVTVELLNSSDEVVATTTTDSAGYYEFTGVSAGTYTLAFSIPSGDTEAAFSTQGAGANATVSSSANSSGVTESFTMSTGQAWLEENVGLTGIPV